jgi:hypothetical protein
MSVAIGPTTSSLPGASGVAGVSGVSSAGGVPVSVDGFLPASISASCCFAFLNAGSRSTMLASFSRAP